MTFDFHPDARREFHDAVHWYEDRSIFAGDRFVKAVQDSIELIMLDPDRYQNLGGSLHVFRLKVFPYRLYYTHEKEENMIWIFAVMHEKKNQTTGITACRNDPAGFIFSSMTICSLPAN